MLQTIISLVSGALGGNVMGGLLKKYSLGTIGNSIVGILGGGIGSYLLSAVGLGGVAESAGSGSLDVMSILSSVASGGVGGGTLMVIIGLIKSVLNK